MDSQSTPPELVNAILDLWRLKPLPRDNLFTVPEYTTLSAVCKKLYIRGESSNSALKFPLYNALLSLGLPVATSAAELAVPPEVAAARLHSAFCQQSSKHTHLCPLDCADELPPLNFGPNSIREIDSSEFRELVAADRLLQFNNAWVVDADRFAEFRWLVVEEIVPCSADLDVRAGTNFYFDINKDFCAIDPHPRHFPTAVEDALFLLLCAPWEDWLHRPDIFNWRAFDMPWIYTIDSDIFRVPNTPPSPDSLSWAPDSRIDQYRKEMEIECPIRLSLEHPISQALSWVDDGAWSDLTVARRSPLFDSPIAHFFVRAFLSKGIDEFLAHIMVIEAALGVHQPKATARISRRLSALLGSCAAGDDFKKLFELRCQFVHGRSMSPIAGQDSLLARSLARRTVSALVKAALLEAPNLTCRQTYLNSLLNKA